MSMEVSECGAVLRIEGPVAHLSASGELDAFTAGPLSHRIDDALDAGCTDFCLDLDGVTFIDAAGVGLLVRIRSTTARKRGTFHVVAASPCVRRLCTLTDLADVLGVQPAAWPARTASDQSPRTSSGHVSAGSSRKLRGTA